MCERLFILPLFFLIFILFNYLIDIYNLTKVGTLMYLWEEKTQWQAVCFSNPN